MKKSELKILYNGMFKDYPDLLTVVQLQRALGISRHLAYELIADGDLRALRVGNSYRIPKASLIDYIYTNVEEKDPDNEINRILAQNDMER